MPPFFLGMRLARRPAGQVWHTEHTESRQTVARPVWHLHFAPRFEFGGSAAPLVSRQHVGQSPPPPLVSAPPRPLMHEGRTQTAWQRILHLQSRLLERDTAALMLLRRSEEPPRDLAQTPARERTEREDEETVRVYRRRHERVVDQSLVDRIVRRSKRLEHTVSAETLVVHSRPRPTVEAPARQERKPPKRADVAAPRDFGGATPQPWAPAADITSLTNQVMRELDRRLIAKRERLGRI